MKQKYINKTTKKKILKQFLTNSDSNLIIIGIKDLKIKHNKKK